mgnify:CR=1 FL=1
MKPRIDGFTLLEVMVALALAALVFTALLTFAQSITATLNQGRALDALSSTARLLHGEFQSVTATAGARANPLQDAPFPAVAGSRSGPDSDVLTVQAFSPFNCFDNDNPVRGPTGQPAWWVRRNEYAVRDRGRLVRSCFYGPADGQATRQLNAATLVEGVETLRLRFGIDTTGDRRVDRWVPAGGWSEERGVLAIRVGVVLVTEHSVGVEPATDLALFGRAQPAIDDGRARLGLTLTLPVRGRL